MILLSELPLNVEQQNLNPNYQLNLQAITLFSSQKHFLLQPNYKKSLINSKLLIDRHTGQIEQVKQNTLTDCKPHYFSLFLGILQIDGNKLLCLVQQAMLVCTIHRRDLFRITKPIFIFFQKGLKPTQQQNIQIRAIASIFKSGTYFSYSYNLTQRMASEGISSERNSQFNWIHHLQQPLRDCKARWLIPVIQGFVGKFQIYVQGKKLTMMLISRRSTRMAGTRYLSRGIDGGAEVANFVETEQVVMYESYAFSYVQVRGSVPLYWKQVDQYKGLVKDIEMLRDYKENREICQEHLDKLHQQYGEITILNLLQQSKKSQAKLISSFQKVVKDLQTQKPDTINYAYYDAKKGSSLSQKAMNANFFIQHNLLYLIQKQKFDCFRIDPNTQSRELLQSQSGIFRTNCLDCVQRTGRIQSRVSALALLHCLKSISIDLLLHWKGTQLQFFDDFSHPLAHLFRNLWADNADYISQQYTGTDSIHSHYTRTGKQTIIDPIDQGLKSIWRTVIDMGSYDVEKQKAIQKILGGEGGGTVEELGVTERRLIGEISNRKG